MKIGIISDTHFGDNNCKLIENNKLTTVYDAFRDEVIKFLGGSSGRLNYLVLNGDILDFSINSFDDSCRKARHFFDAIERDNLTEKIILIPGNHDKYIWDVVEWERHVIMKMQKHEYPETFTRTQPALIDINKNSLELPYVNPKPGTSEFGGLFLEGFFSNSKSNIGIIVVYPNLYIKASDNTYIVSHGHMLESAWVLLSELMGDYPSVSKKTNNHIGLRELEELNKPLSDMICSSIGQGGPVSDVFYKIQVEAKNGKVDELKNLLNSLHSKLDDLIELPWYAEGLDNALFLAIKKMAFAIIEKGKNSRYDKDFYHHQSVRDRFAKFYKASCEQVQDVFHLNPPNRLIFGHTHEPIDANKPMIINPETLPQVDFSSIKNQELFLYNSGGWLKDVDGKSADVFFFNDNGDITSFNIA